MPGVLSARLPAAASALVLLLLLNGCALDSNAPAPRPSASAEAAFRCPGDDVPVNVLSLGWAFCRPKGWSIVQRSIPTSAPVGVDTTLDVVASDGFFGFMIIGSYQRGDAPDLKSWLSANEPTDTDVQPITWANAREAVAVNGQLKRYALTDHRVYALTEREGAGNLDLDSAMQPRLATWAFAI